MIPVQAAAEPAGFDASIRQPGLAWLKAEGLEGVDVKPVGKEIKAYWTTCIPDLMTAYSRICAYASLRIPRVVGAHSVEHFAPKSSSLTQAYEWSNYRLVCAKLNSRKNNFTDVLDPFALAPDTFRLVVLTGAIEIAPHVVGPDAVAAQDTIDRLDLDDGELRDARLFIIDEYFAGKFTTEFLQEESPFIWGELKRQNRLRP